mgnify:CR=1 FL=1
MEEIINRIISLDKETVKVKKHTDEVIAAKEKQLKETLQNLENRYIEEGRSEGEKRYKEILEASDREVEQLIKKEESKLKKIEIIYKENKHRLVEELFQSLLSKN